MRSNIVIILMILTIAFGLSAQFHAGPPMDTEMREQLKTIRKWRLLEDLALDEEQTAKFLPLMTKYQNEMEKIDAEIEERSTEIRDLVFDEKGNDKNLSQKEQEMLRVKTLELVELRSRIGELDKEIVEVAAEFLEPMQLFSLVTFERRFNKEIRQLLKKFWHERGGPPSPGEEMPGYHKKK